MSSWEPIAAATAGIGAGIIGGPAAGLAVGSSVLGGVSSIREGQAAKVAAEARRDELAREAQLATTAATQAQTANYMELSRTLGGIRALEGTRGVNPDSPSAAAIESGVQDIYATNRQRTAFDAAQHASQSNLAGKAAMMSGNAALTSGYLRGFGSFFQAATEANSIFGTKKKSDG